MKKALGGCLAVVLLLLLVGGGAGYWFIVRPLWNTGSAFYQTAEQWQQIAALEKDVRNTSAFNPPGHGRLDDGTLARFLDVQTSELTALGNDWQKLDQRFRRLEAERKASGREPGLQETVEVYRDVTGLLLTAKQAQIAALNRNGMSLAQYRWARLQAFQTLPLLASEQVPAPLAGSATAANAELLRPHRDLLQRTLPLNVLGF